MKGGVLEVLLVNADGLKHSHLIGTPALYAVVQCGTETCKGKITSGKDKRVWWNQKFVFKLTPHEWQNLSQLTVKIMKKGKFTEDDFLGETTVHLGGILREGSHRGCIDIRPAPYNVVQSDGKYEGEIKIGFKLIPNVEVEGEREGRGGSTTEITRRPASYRALLSFSLLGRIPWPKFLFFGRCARTSPQLNG